MTGALAVRALPGAGVHELPASYPYPEPAWSPYLVGGLIGLLTLVLLSMFSRRLGASSGYADIAGLAGRGIAPNHTNNLAYFRENPPSISWTLVFVVGIVVGAFLAAWTGGETTGVYLQNLWLARFGEDSLTLRTATSLVGGMVMAFGARMAGGCTSGHGISGTLQLAPGSWIAVVAFFIGGIVTAMLLYRL